VSERENNWSDLLRAAMAGDAAAYHRFLVSIEPALRSVARRGLRRAGLPDGDGEDIVQEILLAVHLKRHTWEPERAVVPWILAIARHKLIDTLRHHGRRSYVPLDEVAEALAVDDPAPALPTARLRQNIQDLPPRQRDVIRAVSVEGLSIRDAAVQLRISEGAVRVALHRGLAMLAAQFAGEDR
jgi:RNA polymerase sigma-70 factor (ECF subfamily)